MDQFVVLIIVGLIAFVEWLLRTSAERRAKRRAEKRGEVPSPGQASPFDAPRPTAHPLHLPPREDAEDEAARKMRRFLEALGVPEEALPPQPIQQEAPAPTPPPVAVVEAAQPPKPAPRRTRKPSREEQELARRLAATGEDRTETFAGGGLSGALRSRRGLQQAVVLREILGPPKALAEPAAERW